MLPIDELEQHLDSLVRVGAVSFGYGAKQPNEIAHTVIRAVLYLVAAAGGEVTTRVEHIWW